MADLPTVSQAEVELRAQLDAANAQAIAAELNADRERERRKQFESNAEGAHLRAYRSDADAAYWKKLAMAAQAAELALTRKDEASRQIIAMLTSERDALRSAVGACNGCVPIATAHRWLEEQKAAHLAIADAFVAQAHQEGAQDRIPVLCVRAIANRPAIGGDHG
jgi:hypothetical protein